MVKGNKGEWSEFYAFIKILTDKKLFAGNSDLKLLKDKFYIVLKIIREETKTGRKNYDVSKPTNLIVVTDEKGKVVEKWRD